MKHELEKPSTHHDEGNTSRTDETVEHDIRETDSTLHSVKGCKELLKAHSICFATRLQLGASVVHI